MTIAIEQLGLKELQAFLREQAKDAFPDMKDEQRLSILSEKWHTRAEFCTCRDNNRHLIGMIAFYANQFEEGLVYIPHVYVNKNNRNIGLFTKLLFCMKEYVKAKGFRTIQLEVHSDNICAQKAYLNTGFKFMSGKMGGGNSRYMQLLL